MYKQLIAGMLMSTSAFAGDADLMAYQKPNDFNHFVLSAAVNTANNKMTDTNIKNIGLNQSFALTYLPTAYTFLNASLSLMGANTFGYKATAGLQLPNQNLTPYVDMTYNHANSDGNKANNHVTIDYAVGTAITADCLRGVSFFVEAKNLIKDNESGKVGISYALNTNMSISSDYSMDFKNKSNGLEVGIDYSFD